MNEKNEQPGVLKRIANVRSPEARERWARRLWWLHSLWAMTAGALVVIYAGRDFEKARWLILMLLAVWLLIVGFYRVFGREKPHEQDGSLQMKVGFLVFTYALKNLYQAMIFFLLPFYWRSASLGTPNQWFVVLLGLSGFVATLDLVFDRVLMRYRLIASSYFVITLFAAINLAIPALLPEISASWALLIASMAAMLVFWTFHVPLGQLRERGTQLIFVGAMTAAVLAGFALRPVVPPVPHYVLEGHIGRLLVHDRLSEEANGFHVEHLGDLYAQTRLLAPGGADSDFRHVWRHNGKLVLETEPRHRSMAATEPSVVTLTSHLPDTELPAVPTGKWTVDVLTDDDRLVGRVRFRIYK